MSIKNDLNISGKVLWYALLTVVVIAIIGGFMMIIKPAFLVGDRIITKTSFQYTEGKGQEMLTMYSDYAGLASRIVEVESTQQGMADALRMQQKAIKGQICMLAQQATTRSAVPDVIKDLCNL